MFCHKKTRSNYVHCSPSKLTHLFLFLQIFILQRSRATLVKITMEMCQFPKVAVNNFFLLLLNEFVCFTDNSCNQSVTGTLFPYIFFSFKQIL